MLLATDPGHSRRAAARTSTSPVKSGACSLLSFNQGSRSNVGLPLFQLLSTYVCSNLYIKVKRKSQVSVGKVFFPLTGSLMGDKNKISEWKETKNTYRGQICTLFNKGLPIAVTNVMWLGFHIKKGLRN